MAENKHGGARLAVRPDDKRLVPEPKKRVTFRLSPSVIELLKSEKNKSGLVEKLLIEYFERIGK